MTKLYKFVKGLVKLVTRFLCPFEVKGIEHLDTDNNYIIMMNHKHLFDPLYLIDICPRHIHFFAKKELQSWPVLNLIYNNLDLIFVDRSKKGLGTTEKGINYLEKGEVVGIFPEGTRNKTSNLLLPFRHGAFSMAYESDKQIIPVVMKGSPKLFRKGVSFEILKPVKISKNLDKEINDMKKIYEKHLIK